MVPAQVSAASQTRPVGGGGVTVYRVADTQPKPQQQAQVYHQVAEAPQQGGKVYSVNDQPQVYQVSELSQGYPAYYTPAEAYEQQQYEQQYEQQENYQVYMQDGEHYEQYDHEGYPVYGHEQVEVATVEDTTASTSENEFMRLLDSLEVRVDLMAQMQQTRNQIKERAQMLEGGGQQLDNGEPADWDGAYVAHGAGPNGADYADELPLAEENAELRRQSQEQRQCIARLMIEVEGLRTQLRGLGIVPGAEGDEMQSQLQEIIRQAKENDVEVKALREQLREERLERERDRQAALRDRAEMMSEIKHLRGMTSTTPPRGASREPSRAPSPSRARSPQPSSALSSQQQLPPPPREPRELRDTLQQQVDAAIRSSNTPVGGNSPSHTSQDGVNAYASLPTTLVLPIEAVDRPRGALDDAPRPSSASEKESLVTAPFSRTMCGVNVSLSEDGYVATRTRGCRQSVLIGSEPIARQSLGWYFEVEVREKNEGWVGGLGIGVTKTGPGHLKRVPDKAWRMPHTFVVGYWGCVFIDGKELRTSWRVDSLPVGSKVGVLISESGDLRVFANGELAVFVEGALASIVSPRVELFPVVDVFAATLAVELAQRAKPPPPPWRSENAAAVSPTGSPTGSLVSAPRTFFGPGAN